MSPTAVTTAVAGAKRKVGLDDLSLHAAAEPGGGEEGAKRFKTALIWEIEQAPSILWVRRGNGLEL